LRLGAFVEQWAMNSQKIKLARSPMTAVLMVQQMKIQPKVEQKGDAAESRAEI
jgi:hypothetical protein